MLFPIIKILCSICFVQITFGTPLKSTKEILNEKFEAESNLYFMTKKIKEHARTHKKNEYVIAFSCRKTPLVTDFMNLDEILKKPHKKITPSTLKNHPQNILEILDVIRATAIGRAVYSKFEPKYGYEIKIVFKKFDEKTNDKYFGFYMPTDKTIILNNKKQLGELAYVLVHEMMHSLDTDYILGSEKYINLVTLFFKTLKKYLTKENKISEKGLDVLSKLYNLLQEVSDILVFRAERFAYSGSYLVWKELYEKYPDYYNEEPIMFSDEDIIKVTQVNKTNIEKFKRGKCKTFNDSIIENLLK